MRAGLVVWAVLTSCIHVFAQVRSETVMNVLAPIIQRDVSWALSQKPETITAHPAARSQGSLHDFYSEGDYWWPDPKNPGGAYVQRDGVTNPDNFTAHRLAMIRFASVMGALASAYVLHPQHDYIRQAEAHLRAWFIDTATRMNPSLLYAQAIKGKESGRGIGIIDTIHLIEVAQAVTRMEKQMDPAVVKATRQWFADYLAWLRTHKYGNDEMNALNNHGTCWVMQVAAFAKLTRNEEILSFCRERYKHVLLPNQMATDGSFPLELKRTKAYGYSIFNLDAMVMICKILSTESDNLWNYTTPEGKNIKKGVEYLYPYLKDKSTWPLKPDVLYWDNWPVAQPSLLFTAIEFDKPEWLSLWRALDHEPDVPEVIRNLPVRHPAIWIDVE